MVADALVYHPTVSHYLKFVATTGMLLFHFTLHWTTYSSVRCPPGTFAYQPAIRPAYTHPPNFSLYLSCVQSG